MKDSLNDFFVFNHSEVLQLKESRQINGPVSELLSEFFELILGFSILSDVLIFNIIICSFFFRVNLYFLL